MYELSQLAHLDTILARETNIDNIVGIRAQVEALRVYAVNIGKSKDECKEIAMARIKSERRAGQVMLAIPKQNGARKPDAGFIDAIPQSIDGIKKSQINSWQTIAKLPAEEFERLMLGCMQNVEQEITTAYFCKAAKIHLGSTRTSAYQTKPQAVEVDVELARHMYLEAAHCYSGVEWWECEQWERDEIDSAIATAIEAYKQSKQEGNNNE